MGKKTEQKSLQDLASVTIMAHAIDPEKNPLPEKFQEQYNRVVDAARLLDSYPNQHHVENLLKAKYRVSTTQIRADISLAAELFKSRHTFDWDFWFAWMIKDQVALIQRCREKGDMKTWNAAKKTLREMIGEKPVEETDPQRMMKNLFVIQINNAGINCEIPLDKVKALSGDDKKSIIDALYSPIDEKEAMEIIQS